MGPHCEIAEELRGKRPDRPGARAAHLGLPWPGPALAGLQWPGAARLKGAGGAA